MPENQKYNCEPKNWVNQYSDELFRFTVTRVKNKEIAEDLVQDTFLSGLKSVKGFRGDCHEISWLYNILRNKIIDHYRKKTNQELKQSSLSKNSEEDKEETFYNRFFNKNGHWGTSAAPENWGISADELMEREEFMQFLMLCLSLLPDMWSKVFSLKNIEEYSTKEICKELAITPSNLWTIIHRAKLQLRGCLEKKWMDQ